MSDRPAIAVIGSGYWGKNLVRVFYELGCLALVCDPSESALSALSAVAPGVEHSKSYQAVLQGGIDAAVIATPAETHYALAKHCLDAGKDVFVEKPLALHQDQGAELVRSAALGERILMVGHILEYHPAVVRLRELTREGKLGRIQYIYSNRLSLGKIRREENILWSFAPHDIAVIMRLIGSAPFQVSACGGSYVQPNIADVTLTNLLFNNNVRAHIHVSWLHPFKEQRLVVIGDVKMAVFDDVAKQLILHDQRVEVKDGIPTPIKGAGTELIEFSRDEPLRLECLAFLEALKTRRRPLTDGLSGLGVLSVLEAAQRSLILNGVPVEVARNMDLSGG